METTGIYFLYKIELSYLNQMGQIVGSVPTKLRQGRHPHLDQQHFHQSAVAALLFISKG